MNSGTTQFHSGQLRSFIPAKRLKWQPKYSPCTCHPLHMHLGRQGAHCAAFPCQQHFINVNKLFSLGGDKHGVSVSQQWWLVAAPRQSQHKFFSRRGGQLWWRLGVTWPCRRLCVGAAVCGWPSGGGNTNPTEPCKRGWMVRCHLANM